MPARRLAKPRAALAALAALTAGVPALAQEDAPAPALGAAAPNVVVTETHGDWEIACLNGESPCEMRQDGMTADGQRALTMSLRKVEPQQTQAGTVEALLTITTPISVLLRQGIALKVDEGEVQRAQYTICQTNGCTLTDLVPNALVDSFKRGAQAQLGYVFVQNNQAVQVESVISLTGFTAAYNALTIE